MGGEEDEIRCRTSGSGGYGSFNWEVEGGWVAGGFDREIDRARDRCSRRVKRKRDRGVTRDDGVIRFIGIGGMDLQGYWKAMFDRMSMEG